MKTKHTLFFILFLSFSLFVFSQNNKPDEATGLPNDLDSKYTPDKSSLFSSSDAVKTAGYKSEDSKAKNVVTFSIDLLTRSTAAFFYERAVSKIISVQAGLGATFSKDYMQQVFVLWPLNNLISQVNSTSNNPGQSMKLSDIIKYSSSSGTNIFLSGALRMYMSGTAPKGAFVELGMRYSAYNYQISSSSIANSYNGNTVQGSPNISVQDLSFNIAFGYQFVVGIGKAKFVNTLYGGVGVKKITYDGLTETNNYNSSTGYYSQSYYTVGPTQTAVLPTVLIGLSLGFGL